MNRGRQASRLPAEDEYNVRGPAERSVPEQALGFCGEEIRFAEDGELALERVPVVPLAEVDVFPVVESGSAHFAVVEGKTEWLHQVQRGTGGKAGPPGVSGVPVDLGMNENDVNRHP